jgi:hypothetical protein
VNAAGAALLLTMDALLPESIPDRAGPEQNGKACPAIQREKGEFN